MIDHLKSYGTYSHSLESVWVLVSSRSAAEIRDAAAKYQDENDKILVVQLNGDGAWRNLREKTSAWLKKNL